jgi:hypothetical protein
MATARVDIKCEVKFYGLWRLSLLNAWARWLPSPSWLIRLVVSSAGAKTKAHAGPYPRKWECTPFAWTEGAE